MSLHRVLASFVEQRNTSPQPHAYDLRTNQFLRDIEPTTGPGTDPQLIINHLVDLHDAGSSVEASPIRRGA